MIFFIIIKSTFQLNHFNIRRVVCNANLGKHLDLHVTHVTAAATTIHQIPSTFPHSRCHNTFFYLEFTAVMHRFTSLLLFYFILIFSSFFFFLYVFFFLFYFFLIVTQFSFFQLVINFLFFQFAILLNLLIIYWFFWQTSFHSFTHIKKAKENSNVIKQNYSFLNQNEDEIFFISRSQRNNNNAIPQRSVPEDFNGDINDL